MYYSPKANQAIKEVFPLDDMDLVTHFLCMCLTRWQTQCNLTKNTTPVSTRALLLELENIKNDVNLDHKSQNPSKPRGAEGKCKRGLSEYCIPKEAHKGLVHWKLPERQGEKQFMLCKKQGPFKSHNTCDCCHFNKDGTLSRIVGAQVGLNPLRRGPRVQILCR